MAAFDLGTGSLSVLALAAGVVAAVVLAVVVMAWRRGRLGTLILTVGVLLTLAGVGAILFELKLERGSVEGRAFERRADELAARALVPDSTLACLDASAGSTVDTACEGRLFGRPENIAAAVTYTAARLALLSEGATLAGDDAKHAGAALAALRSQIEADKFGVVAHVLAVNAGCTVDRCDAFALVANADHIKSNLREGAFERFVERHAKQWPTGEEKPATSDATPRRGFPGARPPLVARPLSPGQDFPSAASIPPVSIMAPEPPRTPEPAAAGGERHAAESPAPRAPASPPPLPRPARRSSNAPVSIVPQRPAATTAPGQN
jgi:hypothetical protein